MKELVEKAFNEKMQNGDFEKIIGEKVQKMMESICDDLMRWDGSVKTQMKAKIEPLMTSIIEETNFNDYTIKLTTIINECLKQTSLNDYKNIGESLKSLLNDSYTENYKFQDVVKISTLFEKYCKFIESEFNSDDFDNNEEYVYIDEVGSKSIDLPCSYEMTKDKNSEDEYRHYFSRSDDKKHIVFSNIKADEDNNEFSKTRIEFDLRKNYDGKYVLDFDCDSKINDLQRLPSFILELMKIKNNFCEIILDEISAEKEAHFGFEREY